MSTRGMFVALALAFVLASTPAQAATANFQGNCTTSSGSPISCLFSPNKAPQGQPFTGCNGNGLSSYSWDFGDGTSATTFPTVDFGRASHTYPSGFLGVFVDLTVHCSNGDSATVRHCVTTNPSAGCVVVNLGWSP